MSRPIPFGICAWNDPVLRQRAGAVTDITSFEIELAAYMSDVLRGCSNGLGVAANQVGVATSIFVYRDFNLPDTVHAVVNPHISESSGSWEYREGCLSMPGIYFDITRPKRVLLKGTNLDGGDVEIEADTLLARLFQHEMDHLAGRLILDRVSKGARSRALRKMEAG